MTRPGAVWPPPGLKGIPMDMYHIHTHDHGISMVVGAKSYRHAARIVAEVIAESDPPGEGGVCCVDKLCGPDGGRHRPLRRPDGQ